MDRREGRLWSAAALLLMSACTGNITPFGSGERGLGVSNGAAGSGGPLDPTTGAGAGASSGAGAGGAGANSGGGANGGAGGNAGTSGGAAALCVTPAVGATALRRLTHAEYDNAVRDLLGVTSKPARAFPPDTQVGLFDNTTSAQTVSPLLADQYLETAVALAEGVTDLGGLIGCDPSAADAAPCLRAFVERFGRKAYRRPLTSEEVDALLALHDDTRAQTDAATGVRSMIAAMLSAPAFLFRPETGGADVPTVPGAKQALPFELAGRLAALIWASVPDDVLLDAAQNGELQTREQVADQARRMLDDDKARPALVAFYEQWLGLPALSGLSKDPNVFPMWSDALRDAMFKETRRLIEHVLFEDDAKLATLYTAPYSFVNASLAELYGVSGPSDDATFERVMLGEQRSGVLTQGSFMSAYASASESSPIKRGKWVRVNLLCQDLPNPPANVPPPPEPAEGLTTRERFALHTDHDACRGCHALIDGLGFGLEHYDGMGAYRAQENGEDVDATGEITLTDVDGPYEGGPELARLLSTSAEARDCVPKQWLRYALGRREGDDDACALAALEGAFASSGGDLRELMVALTQTDAFMSYRQPE